MSTELETWVRKNSPAENIRKMMNLIDIESTVDTDGIDSAVTNIMQKVLTAETEEDIFAAANAGAVSGKEYINKPYLLKNDEVHYRRSGNVYTDEGGFPWYILANVTDLTTGEILPLTCGGLSYVTTVYRLQSTGILKTYDDAGGIPLINTAKQTGKGFNVILVNKFNMPKVHTGAAGKTKD